MGKIFPLILAFCAGMFIFWGYVTFNSHNIFTTKKELILSRSLDSLRILLLSARLNGELNTAKLKVATLDFKDDKEKAELEKKVYDMEAKILIKARSYSELEIVINNILISSPNFKSIPSIIPLKPGTYKRLSSGFGYRMHPVIGKEKFHTGIDISAPAGTPVFAPAEGVVTRVDPYYTKSGYGNRVMVKHKFGFETLYGHLSAFNAKVGQIIKIGDIIGFVGSTGISTGPHLHYEIIKNGYKINPIDFTTITMKKLKIPNP